MKEDIIKVNFYEMYRCLSKMGENLKEAENDWAFELNNISEKIIEGEIGDFYNKERLLDAYVRLTMIRDHMHCNEIEIPERNFNPIMLNALNRLTVCEEFRVKNRKAMEVTSKFIKYRLEIMKRYCENINEKNIETIKIYEEEWYNKLMYQAEGMNVDPVCSQRHIAEIYFVIMTLREFMHSANIEVPRKDTLSLMYKAWIAEV